MAQGNQLIVRDNTDLTKGSTNAGQPGYPTPPDQYMSSSQVRDLFLQTALYRCIMTDTTAWSTGSTVITKIPQTGFAQKIRILYQTTVSVATVLAAGPTAKAPYSLLSAVLYNDPSGNVRINAPAFMIYLLNVSKRTAYDPANGSCGDGFISSSVIKNLIFTNPTPAVAVANVRSFIDLYITMSDYDTRGGMLLESATSPSFLQLVMNSNPMDANATASIESPYTNNATATTITLAGNFQPVYYFWQPAYVRGPHGAVLPLPTDDLNMVHEIISQRNVATLNANTDNRFTFPTGRSYYTVCAFYVNNNAPGIVVGATPGASAVKFAYDNANFTLNENLQAYLSRTRKELNRDLPVGAFRWDSSDRPWDSNHYGQLDAIITFDGTTLTTPYIDYIRDTLYMAPIA